MTSYSMHSESLLCFHLQSFSFYWFNVFSKTYIIKYLCTSLYHQWEMLISMPIVWTDANINAWTKKMFIGVYVCIWGCLFYWSWWIVDITVPIFFSGINPLHNALEGGCIGVLIKILSPFVFIYYSLYLFFVNSSRHIEL
jgi:hypothetical protein